MQYTHCFHVSWSPWWYQSIGAGHQMLLLTPSPFRMFLWLALLAATCGNWLLRTLTTNISQMLKKSGKSYSSYSAVVCAKVMGRDGDPMIYLWFIYYLWFTNLIYTTEHEHGTLWNLKITQLNRNIIFHIFQTSICGSKMLIFRGEDS